MKHEFLRRLSALILCLVLALGLAAPALAVEGETTEPGTTEPETPADESIKLDKEEITLFTKQTAALTATVTPEEAEVKWSSSDESVATVDDKGVVTAVNAGEAVITAESNGQTAECKVTVDAPTYVISINLPIDEYQFKSSSKPEDSIGIELYPTDADYDSFVFKSEDESVVTAVNESSETMDVRRYMRITAVAPGETYVTADLKGVAGQTPLNQLRFRVTVSGITVSDSAGNELSETKPLTMTMGTSQNVSVTTYGDAKDVSKVDWYSENNAIVSVNSAGRLTPMSTGSTRIVATRGNYSASFRVTVNENTTGLVPVSGSIPAGSPMSFGNISSDIKSTFYEDTEPKYGEHKTLSYVTSLYVSPTQGVLYNGYISEADTGSGVSMSDRFYASGGVPGGYLIDDLTFVPNSAFSGTAEISYTGVSRDNSTISGIIRVRVAAMEDVSYTTGSGQNVFFRGSDFNTICRLNTGRDLASVTFTLPSTSRGTLYYNYTGNGQYSEKVESTTRYRRIGNPNLDGVSFLPADKYSGSVRISYRGTDTAGGTFSGYVTVTVTEIGDDADLTLSAKAGKEISFTTSKFRNACIDATGESLDRIQFTLPDSSEGTLYRVSGNNQTKITEKTWFYPNSTPYISDIKFVPAKNAPSQIRIAYTGRSTKGTVYTGTVLIDYSGTAKSDAISYSVYSGRAVQFDVSDFNNACIDATGSTLNYVYFDIPSASRGLLYYNYTSTGTPRSVSSTTRYYRSASSGNRIDRVWFLADPGFSGTVDIGYTGYSNDGESFTGTVNIRVSSLAPAEVRFSGVASQAIDLSASQIRYACNAVMDKELSYIEFTSLPSSTQGRIYRGYTGYDTGTQVVTGTPYYVSASPGIDQLSFVPRGSFSGTAYAGYTGVSTSGEKVSGQICFVVSGSGSSGIFNDMGSYSWAVPAAEYLYRNGVVNGVGDGRFAPGDNIKRCDFVVMLCRAYNFSGGSGMSFADVPSNSYYASAVSTASGLGIVNGDGRNFNPNSQLTRQDAMVIVKRALEAAGWSLGGNSGYELNAFGDGNSVAGYARDAVAALVRLGAVNGDSGGNLRPWAPINRAEAAVILHYVMTM